MMKVISCALLASSALVAPLTSHAQTAPKPDASAAPAEADAGDPASSSAAQQSGGGVAEIVVTAQRRSENLQRVPVVVAVSTQDELQRAGISDVQNLKLVAPGVEVQSLNGSALPIVRGVGSKAIGAGIETPVAIYVDDVYIAAATSTLLSFNNIAQVEVLKGPQGTLFGRNATGGLIQVRTLEPTSTATGRVAFTYGNYQKARVDAYVSGGLTKDLAGDIAFSSTTMGKGYGRNLVNGAEVYKIDHDFGVRSKLLFRPSDATSFKLIGDYSSARNSMNAAKIGPGATAPAPYGPAFTGRTWDIAVDEPPLVKNEQGGVSLRIDQDLGDIQIASITAYRKSTVYSSFDFDYTATRGRYAEFKVRDSQFSQELQLLSPSGGSLTWVAGAYYFKASARYPFAIARFAGPAVIPTNPPTIQQTTRAEQKTDSISGFGQATLAVTDGLKLTAGLRYTSEKRTLADATQFLTRTDGSTVTLVPLYTESRRFNKLTWRLAVDYQFTNDLMAYASYNRGFKSGGFNPQTLTAGSFRPEVLDAYEVGFKSTLFDRKLRFNASGYYYDYKDVQLIRALPIGTGIYNSAKAEIYGVDVEAVARITNELDLRVGYQYNHGEYTSFPGAQVAVPRAAGGYAITTGDVSGNTTVLSPKSTLSATGTYTVPVGGGSLEFSGTYYHNSGYFHEPDNVIRTPAYDQLSGSIQWNVENGLFVQLWGNNLTNVAVPAVDGVQSLGTTGLRRTVWAAPRTYGATVGFKF
ncbi:TonB-dependent receptor [Sphingomonas sp. MG17]|uniref:TonB-dependent receptor n=1 Tax=Sphingomonas tagetis TaxID=2949092 RepID=A0A9X2HJM5_9SPHN|nr:TonB-dependent receptor [Sphingomonas tagetis]MCP3730304.1 TonB-dependent receptor [Sphingomonas tagetis]